jgi:hypothetical protein
LALAGPEFKNSVIRAVFPVCAAPPFFAGMLRAQAPRNNRRVSNPALIDDAAIFANGNARKKYRR